MTLGNSRKSNLTPRYVYSFVNCSCNTFENSRQDQTEIDHLLNLMELLTSLILNRQINTRTTQRKCSLWRSRTIHTPIPSLIPRYFYIKKATFDTIFYHFSITPNPFVYTHRPVSIQISLFTYNFFKFWG